MKIFDVRRERVEDAVEAAATVIFSGGTIAYPDETGYVMACDPLHADAVAAVYEAAGRRNPHEVAICVASGAELLEFAPENPLAALAVRRLLPEPVAFLVRRPTVYASVAGTSSAATFRVPNDALAHSLLDRCGPLIACTTGYDGAGLEGAPHADVLLERGEVTPRLEASVVDLTGDRARLVFEGAAPFDRLAARFGAAEFTR